MQMSEEDAWKNFNLGEELSISGMFIYNGLRRFHEMRLLDFPDEIFEFLYNLSVGLERLLKIAVVLIEHKEDSDQEALEGSLITHNHQELIKRVRKHHRLNLGPPHNALLALLSRFYKSNRYGRFVLSTVYDTDRERRALCGFLSRYLHVDLEKPSGPFPTQNDTRCRKFVRKLVLKIATELFELVRDKARELNLYTYELRHGSRAETIFLGQGDLPAEEVLWKELLVFFMNTEAKSGYLDFLRSIEPLDFDPELAGDYLQCLQSDAAKAQVVDELEHLYNELETPGERLDKMDVIASPDVHFYSDEDPDEDDGCF